MKGSGSFGFPAPLSYGATPLDLGPGAETDLDRISELEGVVLGIVATHRACTAYAVRAEIRRSPSTRWSASAGAIYPLLRRLEAAGLVRGTKDPEDGRGRRHLQLTPEGERAHKVWLLRASSPDVAAEIADAVRTRVFSLGALTPAERLRFARDALEALVAHLAVTRADLEEARGREDSLPYLAARGGVLQAEARVAWMRDIVEHLEAAAKREDG